MPIAPTPALPAPSSDRSADSELQLDAPTPVTPQHHKPLSPTLLAYAMAPVALVILLAFRHWNVVAREPIWLYVVVLVVPMLCSVGANRWYASNATAPRLHLRVAAAATSVTVVIFLSGWGPVAVGAYAIIAVESIARCGSKAWRVVALWTVIGIVCGQVAIGLGWAPSFLPLWQAQSVAALGVVVSLFVIRMVGATGLQKELAEAKLADQALHDSLTGLPNRLLLMDRLRQGIARARRGRSPYPVVMFLDLDRFKLVNDSCGHSTGDAVLVQVAERLSAVLRESDTLARFGGDEFVVVCDELSDRDLVLAFAQRIMDVFAIPFVVANHSFQLGASIGVAVLDEDDLSLEGLLSDADSAMYFAKTCGGQGKIQVFDKAIRAMARQRTTTESDLGYALEHSELVVYYQPIVETSNGHVVGVEALLRWQHPTRGLLMPAAFLDLAEQTGLIVPIGEWVLSQACENVQTWNVRREPDEQLALSVNLSARQLAEPDLSKRIKAIVDRAQVNPGSLRLSLEVTETLLPVDQGAATRCLASLHELGIELAIDDFGTGYASLSYVMDLPIAVVKIDRSFVARIGQDPRGEAVVNAVIQLAHTLGLQVVAEGVEDGLQLDFLSAASCDYCQGYLFSRPQPATASGPVARLIPQGFPAGVQPVAR
jgi:diguanylate cyclase (GGDEF)-like protein